MKAEDILYAMGDINDDAVRDARFGEPIQPRRLRRFVTVALAAALLLGMSMTVGAYVGAGDWFKDFFGENGDLTQGQQQYIDHNAVGIGQTVTHNGWSVTVESAITDGRNAYIKLNIAAPEGTVPEADSYFFDNYTFKSSNPVRHPISGSGCGWQLQEDGDGAENTVTVVMKLYVEVLPDSAFSYADGYARTLTLTDLCTRETEYPWEQVTVAEGQWQFTFTLTAEDTEVELLTAPITLQGTRMMGDSFSVQVDSIRMTAMGAAFAYSFFEGDTPEAADFGPATVHLSGGSTVAAWPKAGGIYGPADGWYTNGHCLYVFDSPIDLTEAVEMEFADGTVVEIPR